MLPNIPDDQAVFTDVHFTEDPEPTITYRSGLTTYRETLTKGQFIGHGFNGSGYWGTEGTETYGHAAREAFCVEIGGQLLNSHWQWQGLSQEQTDKGLKVTVELKHEIRPVIIRVCTLLDGTAVFTRWLEIENLADDPAPLSAAFPWSGILQIQKVFNPELVHVDYESTYSLGYFDNTHWGSEGDFHFKPLGAEGTRVQGRYRRNRHRHPMFVLRNNITGEHFFANLAWSGGFCFDFDWDFAASNPKTHILTFKAGPDAPAPMRVIQPRETVTTPELHMGMMLADFDTVVQEMHEHVRKSVMWPIPAEESGLIESGVGPEQEIDEELVFHEIDTLSEVGAELFFIDASWYSPPNDEDHNWHNTVGDWEISTKRFPNGFAPIRDYIHSKGMLWGLWMEPERAAAKSKVFIDHPEWIVTKYDGDKQGGQLDLTKPEVLEWMETQIEHVISDYECDFFRLDYNVGDMGPMGCNTQDDYIENTYWRYYENSYPMWQRLREKFPNVIFEACASGGGRTDIGLVKYFNHTWITDWQIAPGSFTITNGMSIALPPEKIDRLIGMCQNGHRTADIDFQTRLAIFVHPTIGGLTRKGLAPNPIQVQRVKHTLDIYKSFVRPIHNTCRMYHHTPEVNHPGPHGWGVMEMASADSTKAMVGLFRLSDPASDEYTLRLRGLDVSRRYNVTFDNTGNTCVVDGYKLMHEGVRISIGSALTSELLLIEAAD